MTKAQKAQKFWSTFNNLIMCNDHFKVMNAVYFYSEN